MKIQKEQKACIEWTAFCPECDQECKGKTEKVAISNLNQHVKHKHKEEKE